MQKHIPSRYREHVFQGMAHFWADALNNFPKAIIIHPRGLSIDTLVRKLREARVAKETFKWKSANIDENLWLERAHDITITPLTNGTIQMGPTEALETTDSTVPAVKQNEVTVSFRDHATLEHFCDLVSQRAFSPKPLFVIVGLDQATVDSLEARYDMGFLPREDGKSWEVIY